MSKVPTSAPTKYLPRLTSRFIDNKLIVATRGSNIRKNSFNEVKIAEKRVKIEARSAVNSIDNLRNVALALNSNTNILAESFEILEQW